METLNGLCREFSIDRHPEQLTEIINNLCAHKLWNLATLLQSLLKDTTPTILGGTILNKTGLVSQQSGIIPYHMDCFVNASDTLNNFIIDNNSITRTEHHECLIQMSSLYQTLCQGTNYWDRTKMVIPKSEQRIVVTMTTCKRIELFIQTVQSFLVCCKDLYQIDAWYTVDDNSSSDDRKTMEEMFPWMIFTWKTPEQKGHAKSMNILRKTVPDSVEYIIHLEDDWRYVTHQSYISKSVHILERFHDIGQILFNMHYVENATDIYVDNGILRGEGITTHLVHEFDPIPEPGKFFKFWPHFSLRPGVIRKEIWDKISFDEDSRHFEMSYAHEYMSHGWKTAFFNTITCIHTGRPVNTNIGKNAYELNGEIQFKDSTILPMKYVEMTELTVSSIKRTLKRSEKLKPKNWFFSTNRNDEKKVAFVVSQNVSCIDWDIIIFKIGQNKSLKLTNLFEIDDDISSVTVQHTSIRKILEDQTLKVYICYIK
jgi:hypothetical protein